MAFNLEPVLINTVYNPDQLIAGSYDLVTDTVVLASGQNLLRGALLGQQVSGATATRTATDTGNGTCSAVTVLAEAKSGVYSVVFNAATTFLVFDPNGSEIGNGTAGTAFAIELGFTITAGGTAFVSGDSFTILVGMGNYVLATGTATDGSSNPANWVILAEDTNASAGALNCPVYLAGEFDTNYMTFGTGITAAIAKSLLRDANIYLKTGALVNSIV